MRRNKKLSGQFINLQIDSLPFREYHGKMEDWCFLFVWLLLPLRRCCWKWIVSSGTSTSPLIYRCRRAGGAIDGRQVSATAPACWGPRRKEEPWSEEEEEEEENLPPSAALNLFYTYGNQRIASRDSTTDIINSTHPPHHQIAVLSSYFSPLPFSAQSSRPRNMPSSGERAFPLTNAGPES